MHLAFTVLDEIIGRPARIGELVAAGPAALFEGMSTTKVDRMSDEAFGTHVSQTHRGCIRRYPRRVRRAKYGSAVELPYR